MSVYSTSARRYRAFGWWPIPVHGKTIPVAGATGYKGTVTDEKVAEWIAQNPSVRVDHGKERPPTIEVASNVSLAHRGSLAIDVDEYGVAKIDGREVAKDGVAELRAFARRHGLGPLPATWSSTARGAKSGSRQYLYRISEDVPFRTKPCPAVELCCWHHRHTVVAPTIHPGTRTMYAWYWPGEPGIPPTWGEATDAVPTFAEIPLMPADWFEVFRNTAPALNEGATVVGLEELLATFVEGEPSGLMRYLTAKWENPATPIDHDIMKGEGINVLLLGRAGHPGAREVWELLVERYGEYVAAKRPHEYDRDLYGDEGIVATVVRIAQQKAVKDSDRPRDVLPQVLNPNAAWRKLGVDPDTGKLADPNTPPAAPTLPATAATGEEVLYFLQSYTAFTRPDRLGRRTVWMRNDSLASLPQHAWHMVQDVFAGHYPAKAAYTALREAYTAHGGTDPSGAVTIIRVVLGAALDARKVSA